MAAAVKGPTNTIDFRGLDLMVDGIHSGVDTMGIGALGAPTAGTLTAVHERFGPFVLSTFTLTGVRVPHTDGTTNGSHGSLVLYTFPEGSIRVLGSRQNYTAVAINSTCVTTTAVGVWALGSAAVAAAADGTLATTSVDIGATVAMTLSSGTGAGTTHSAISAVFDGTTTASTLNLNESFTAATSSSNGSLDLTGTISVLWVWMGDD
jgi:hypothetical protein